MWTVLAIKVAGHSEVHTAHHVYNFLHQQQFSRNSITIYSQNIRLYRNPPQTKHEVGQTD